MAFVLAETQYLYKHISSPTLHSTQTRDLACILLTLDLKKAFDTVDHSILIEALADGGLDGAALHWFREYLNGRTQFIRVNGVIIRIANMKYGVPQ